jgi:DNA-binding MarR family transcriptional regulator
VTENPPAVPFGPSAELAELLRRAARRLHRGTKEALAPLGLSGSQARLVRLLADGPLRMSVIAERLAVVARTVTDVVDGAEVAGVVSRRADTADRRSTFVELTPAGRRLLDQLDAARTESAARVFGVLTELQRNQLLALLQAICASDEGCIESLATPEAAATPAVANPAAPDVTGGTGAAR